MKTFLSQLARTFFLVPDPHEFTPAQKQYIDDLFAEKLKEVEALIAQTK